jgi:hypothetical protein
VSLICDTRVSTLVYGPSYKHWEEIQYTADYNSYVYQHTIADAW